MRTTEIFVFVLVIGTGLFLLSSVLYLAYRTYKLDVEGIPNKN